MRYILAAAWLMLVPAAPAVAATSVSIGINLGAYPRLVTVPGYPVYYAPSVNSNYFFYDGMYWVFDGDNWYDSPWYNGPWTTVDRYYVPSYVLQVPVRYYRRPPVYFHGWSVNAAPRWHEHWGNSWVERRGDWNRYDRRSVPARAPLPAYQRQYSGNRYPTEARQVEMHTQNYPYQPRDQVVQQHYQERGFHGGQERRVESPAPQREQRSPREDRPRENKQ